MRLAFIIAIFGVIYGAVTDRANSISQIAGKSERRRNRKYCKPSMSASRRKRRRCPPPIHSDSTKPEIDPEKLRPISSKKAKVVSERRMLKQDWCKAQPLRVEVSHPGCKTRKIINKYCYGQCNSFFIPNTDMGEPVFTSCSYCKPHKMTPQYVTLKCRGAKRRQIQKKIEIIEECRCQSHAVSNRDLGLHQDL